MKASVATTVIICGTLLIITPYISHVIGAGQVLAAMTKLAQPVNIDTGLKMSFHKVCMSIGVLMIVTGIIGSLVKRK